MANYYGSSFLFPSPNSGSNGDASSYLIGNPRLRLPFPACTSSTMYQFPAPVDTRCSTGHVSAIRTSDHLQSAQRGVSECESAASSGGLTNQIYLSHETRAQNTLVMPDVVNGQNFATSTDPSGHQSVSMGDSNLESNGFSMDSAACGGVSEVTGHRGLLQPHVKRRANPEDLMDAPANKVFINEDRMSARMQGLHLDNNNLEWHPNLEEESPWYSQGQRTNGSAHRDQNNSTSGQDGMDIENGAPVSAAGPPLIRLYAKGRRSLPKLELSKEVHIACNKEDSILPSAILKQLSKPCLDVVLWKPQGDIVKEIVNNVDQNKEEEEDSSSTSPSPPPPDVVMDTIVPNSSNKTPDVCHGGVDHAVSDSWCQGTDSALHGVLPESTSRGISDSEDDTEDYVMDL